MSCDFQNTLNFNFAKYTKLTKTYQVQSPVVPNREVSQFKSENKVDKARSAAPLIEIWIKFLQPLVWE